MKFAIGTAQFGSKYGALNHAGLTSPQDVSQILEMASKNGIDTLDTAIGYGVAEQVLGEVGVSNFHIISKVSELPQGELDIGRWMVDEVNFSITRLKVKSLYGLLLHRPSELISHKGEAIYRALKNIQELGLVKKIGISIYDPSDYFNIPNKYKFDLVQLPFSVLDRRALDTGLLDHLHKKGVEVHVRSVFLQGLLLAEIEKIPKKFQQWLNFFDEWDRWTKERNITKIEACLGFLNSYSSISRVIVGVDNVTSLKDILGSANTPLSQFPDFTIPNIDDLINPYKWSKF